MLPIESVSVSTVSDSKFHFLALIYKPLCNIIINRMGNRYMKLPYTDLELGCVISIVFPDREQLSRASGISHH